ncbi:MAG: N-acetylmuramoyl-L-alanine amidase [Gammaproteobacteria bacterium]|nr:N-acetylmuramoyl-L-alanine amidase [Gammaproteobacteria bacterium]
MVPTHIVLHITGHNDLTYCLDYYTQPKMVSPHYLIDKQGDLYQLVADDRRAWHAGIPVWLRKLYTKPNWRCYMQYFPWYKAYPSKVDYVGETLEVLSTKEGAVAIHNPDDTPFSVYGYFDQRWGAKAEPLNFLQDPDPNNYSIGIETLGVGGGAQEYSPAMYVTLRELLCNLKRAYGIPLKKGWVVGHEDVNPVGRWGWDPGVGFDWQGVWLDDEEAMAA